MKKLYSHLSKDLREKYKRRSVSIRVGDKVKIMRGKYKGLIGAIVKVNRKKEQVFVENVKRKKADGKEVFVPIHPSKLLVIELKEDKWRMNKLVKENAH